MVFYYNCKLTLVCGDFYFSISLLLRLCLLLYMMRWTRIEIISYYTLHTLQEEREYNYKSPPTSIILAPATPCLLLISSKWNYLLAQQLYHHQSETAWQSCIMYTPLNTPIKICSSQQPQLPAVATGPSSFTVSF